MKREKQGKRKKIRLRAKIHRYLWCSILVMLVVSACTNSKVYKKRETIPKMDYDKCDEVAMQYLKEKYKEDFEFISMSTEYSAMYYNKESTEVMARLKKGMNKDYHVIVYADGYADEDGDGYCDSYKVVSDSYMRELIQEAAREEVEELLRKSGLAEYKIKILYISELSDIERFNGFSPEVPIPDENFSLEEMMKNYPLDIYCYLSVPESAYNEQIKTGLINSFRPKLGDGTMWFGIEIDPGQNDQGTYPEHGAVGNKGKTRIKFSVRED